MKYLGAIIVWGLIVPLVIIAIIGGVLWGAASYMNSEIKARETRYAAYQMSRKKIEELTPKVKAEMGTLLALRDMLLAEQPVALNEALRAADEPATKQNMIRRFAYSSVERSQSGLAGVTQIPFDVIDIGYEGKYGAMQMVLLDVETRRRNLFLERLTITYKLPNTQMGYYQPYESYDARYIAFTGATDAAGNNAGSGEVAPPVAQ